MRIVVTGSSGLIGSALVRRSRPTATTCAAWYARRRGPRTSRAGTQPARDRRRRARRRRGGHPPRRRRRRRQAVERQPQARGPRQSASTARRRSPRRWPATATTSGCCCRRARSASTGNAARSGSTRPIRPAAASSPTSYSSGRRRPRPPSEAGVRVVTCAPGSCWPPTAARSARCCRCSSSASAASSAPAGSGCRGSRWPTRSRAIGFLLSNDDNVGSGQPDRARTGPQQRLHRGARSRCSTARRWRPSRGFALRLALAGFADEGALVSQRVFPRKLLDAGFDFTYPDLDPALRPPLTAMQCQPAPWGHR